MVDHAIVYNPKSAGGKSKKGIELACSYLDDLNVSYEVFESEFAGHIIELATNLAKEGYRVIGAGGDGTCNEVLHGVITSETGALVGFIPLGSGNDIPGAIGIPPDIKRACEIIAEGFSRKTDIGLAKTDKGVERYFLGIGSQGFDAEVTKRTNESRKWFSGTKNYVLNVLKTLFTWKNREVIIKMDNDKFEGTPVCIAVGNGPSYGGWMYICQSARVHDGIFNISVVDIGKLRLLYDFNKMYSASVLPHPKIYEYESEKVRIKMKNSEDEPYLCQVDGEVLGEIPVSYEVIKDGYEFIQPKVDEVAEAFKEKYGRYFYECSEK
ncbi:MAG: Diacylglycerol kinase [Promethearchaeota archaeon]|nr:MAG: Diacylglycerol kinase [Candidatus Lokiarchaeota archaeon]